MKIKSWIKTYLIDFAQRSMIVHHSINVVIFRQRIITQSWSNSWADLMNIHTIFRTLRGNSGRETQSFRPLGQTTYHFALKMSLRFFLSFKLTSRDLS